VHRVAQHRRYSSDLSLTAFSQDNSQPGAVPFTPEHRNLSGCRRVAIQKDSSAPSAERVIVWMTFYVNVVFFGVLIAWMREQVSEFAVVGEQDQSLTAQIQATD
jgi:hypothetical protein